MESEKMKGFTHESTQPETVEWYTPRHIFDAMGIEFDLDPCSPGKDVVPWIPARRHLTIEDNGLLTKWEGNVWLNPPYGTQTPQWLERLSGHGTGIALTFVRPDTKWFHRYAPLAHAICLIKGRVRFVPARKAKEYATGAHKPRGGPGVVSMLMAYGKDNARALCNAGLGLTLLVRQDKKREAFGAAKEERRAIKGISEAESN